MAGESVRRGLSEEVVRDISAKKGEPDWMLDLRLKGLQLFRRKPMPTWGSDLSGIDFENIKDEMFCGAIAGQLRAKGHDVVAVVADPALAGLADDQVLAHATAPGRVLVTANNKDVMPLDARYRAGSQAHAGLILVSAKAFPQDRSFTAAITSALSALLDQTHAIRAGPSALSRPAVTAAADLPQHP